MEKCLAVLVTIKTAETKVKNYCVTSLEFSIEKYSSIKDLTTSSMVAAKSFKEHKETNLINVDRKLNLLKSAAIYGKNASGKSNLLKAMGFMNETVLNSFKDALVENNERKQPYETSLLIIIESMMRKII